MRVDQVNNEKTQGHLSKFMVRRRMVKPALVLREVLAPI